VAIVVVIGFQMAQAGLLNIKIGKNGDMITSKKERAGDHQAQIDNLTDDVNTLKADVKIIKENHLAHIQSDMTKIREDVSFIKGKLSH